MGIKGDLATMGLEDIFQWLAVGRKTGVLHLNGVVHRKKVDFHDGRIKGCWSSDPREYMGQFLLSAGAKGKRYATPHARIMMHQPSGGIGGTASDIKIQAEQMLHIKKQMAELIAEQTGQTLEQIESDSDRDRWFTADAALEYGFIDAVVRAAADVTGSGGTAK